MTKITITEALSEINLIKKKIEHKKTSMQNLFVTASHAKDPYAEEGGSAAFLKKEFQALTDLRTRFVKLRAAISVANMDTEVTINERTMSIHDWLTWKREIVKEEQTFTNAVVTSVNATLNQVQRSPQCYDDAEGKKHLVVFNTNIDLPSFVKRQENLTTMLENLDGQLSLKNATVMVTLK